jgi:hypothetical protein
MGFLDKLRGIKKPAAGVAAKSADEVKAAILAVNRPTAQFQITESSEHGADLVAEWKIVDAKWYEIFAKAGLQKVFKVFMKLHPESNEVRSLDEEWSVEWEAGVPNLQISKEKNSGQITEVEFGSGYAFTEDLSYGQVYKYKFRTSEIKGPLQEAVTSAGWTWRGVTFGKL